MWTAYLFQMTTGQIGPQIQLENASWSVSLNDIESVSIQLRKSDLPRVDLKYWLSPWWAGIILMYDGLPIVGGPIVSRRSESFNYIYLDVKGIRQILAKRLVVQEMSDWSKLAASTVYWKGLSLGTIAKKVVQTATAPKAGGALPISYPIKDQTVIDDADHQRTYKGFNIGNISCHDVLTKISEVSRGPDIMFKPRLIRDDQLTFDMVYGDEFDPRIDQLNTPIWDTTAQKGSITDLDVTHTGAHQTNRVFASGAGQDAGTLIKVITDEKNIQLGYPLLETTLSSGDTTNGNVVLAHAKGSLQANITGLTEIQMTVRAEDENYMGSFWAGDLAYVVLDNSWLSLQPGQNKMRILNINGGLSNEVKLSLQTE